MVGTVAKMKNLKSISKIKLLLDESDKMHL